MTEIVLMRLLYVAGLLALVAAVVLVSYAIVGLRSWLGSPGAIERMLRIRPTRWRTLP
jgi:hypothetical protein